MPKIAYFYGIAISMYYNDHAPPHFHAGYGGSEAKIRIADGQVMVGRLSPTAARIVRRWAELRKAELLANWARGESDDDFERISGPDDDLGD